MGSALTTKKFKNYRSPKGKTGGKDFACACVRQPLHGSGDGIRRDRAHIARLRPCNVRPSAATVIRVDRNGEATVVGAIAGAPRGGGLLKLLSASANADIAPTDV